MTKLGADFGGGFGALVNQIGNWLDQNGLGWLGGTFNWAGDWFEWLSNQLLTTSIAYAQMGEATNTAWQVNGNVQVNGIYGFWYPPPPPTPAFEQWPTPIYGGTTVFPGQPPGSITIPGQLSQPIIPPGYYAGSPIYIPGAYTSPPPIIMYPGG